MSGIVGSAGSKSGIIGETELDYEEGTWTGSISNATVSSTAKYIKIGKMVTATAYLTLTDSPSSSSTALIGLPFTSNATGTWTGTVMMDGADMSTSAQYAVCAVYATHSYCRVFHVFDNGGWDVANSNAYSSGDNVVFSITYEVP